MRFKWLPDEERWLNVPILDGVLHISTYPELGDNAGQPTIYMKDEYAATCICVPHQTLIKMAKAILKEYEL